MDLPKILRPEAVKVKRMNRRRVWICLDDVHYVEVVLDRSPTKFLYGLRDCWGQNREVLAVY